MYNMICFVLQRLIFAAGVWLVPRPENKKAIDSYQVKVAMNNKTCLSTCLRYYMVPITSLSA